MHALSSPIMVFAHAEQLYTLARHHRLKRMVKIMENRENSREKHGKNSQEKTKSRFKKNKKKLTIGSHATC